jgi:hypothetical protein
LRNGKVLGLNSELLHAAIDESREHLFSAAGYYSIDQGRYREFAGCHTFPDPVGLLCGVRRAA